MTTAAYRPARANRPVPPTVSGRRSDGRGRGLDPIAMVTRGVLVVLYGVPLLWVVMTSLKSQSDVLSGDALFIFTPTIAAYEQALSNPSLTGSLLQSVIVASGTTAVVIVLSVPMAYALAKLRGAFAGTILGGLIFLQMIPQSAGVVSLFAMFSSVGLADSTTGLIIANAAGLTPWATVLMRPFFVAVPHAIEEAAAIDGAGKFRTFLTVVLPIARNGIATVAAVMFLVSWGEFVNAISLLLSPEKYPSAALIAQQTSGYGVNWPGLMAFAVLLSLPLLVVYLISFRMLRDGISAGSVK